MTNEPTIQNWVVVSHICFIFTPYLKKIPILTHIFQMDWWNHQLENHGGSKYWNKKSYRSKNQYRNQPEKIEALVFGFD